MIYRLISCQSVIAKVYSTLQLSDDSRWIDMIEWIGEVIGHTKTFYQLEKVQETLQVKDYRVAVPCRMVDLIGIAYNGFPLPYLTGTFDHRNRCGDEENLLQTQCSPGYTINPGWINTNFRDGEIVVAYTAVPTDEDGFPMIPDNESFNAACIAYISMKIFYPKYLNNPSLRTVYNDLVNDWQWYCGQFKANSNMLNKDQHENIKGIMTSLVPNINKNANLFRDLSVSSKSRYNNF